MSIDFSGIWLPVITPFAGEAVDHDALARLARHYAAAGIGGFVACATTGEGALLDADEQAAVFGTLRAAAPGMPVVLGLTQSATQAAAARARALAALAPAGLLATPPVYVRPSQDGIRRHFEAIVQAADLPVLVYNIPYRTGVNVELDTLKALATDTRIAGIKECGGSIDRMLRLVHETPLRVFSGDDNQNFAALCAGAHGAIASSAHLLPALHVRARERLLRGDLAGARRIAVALQPLVRLLFEEPNPAPVKAALAAAGWCEDGLRLPFVPAGEALRERLRFVLDRFTDEAVEAL
ncbi:4-hydroxy-tetrahydrodipicolinate synthase [Burkholderia perseverans]|uniref:4-hydroxy-tetrahydrodipicolinate synthase n=1 Tax=Burkholderia perseverans TaxID=2615214 RepID=UPI001FED8B80|nr:4-hydroxy-tetrahydrodipicolinate synthase [Burkholderia perseverans]